MRLFIAINFDDNIKDALVQMQESMRRQGIRGNYTRMENLHLTLAFIGEYGAPDAVEEALASATLEPFRLALRGYGSFGNLYWAGLEDNDRLSAYVKRLRRALSENGIPFDKKFFSPHITLLRQASAGIPKLRVPSAAMEVHRVSLMRSDRNRQMQRRADKNTKRWENSGGDYREMAVIPATQYEEERKNDGVRGKASRETAGMAGADHRMPEQRETGKGVVPGTRSKTI